MGNIRKTRMPEWVDTDLNHVQRENYLLFCSNIKRCVGKEGTVDMFKRLFFAEHVGDMDDACHSLQL